MATAALAWVWHRERWQAWKYSIKWQRASGTGTSTGSKGGSGSQDATDAWRFRQVSDRDGHPCRETCFVPNETKLGWKGQANDREREQEYEPERDETTRRGEKGKGGRTLQERASCEWME